ncbi:MAG: thioredoxin reductase, partial [Ramlibacter sp.]
MVRFCAARPDRMASPDTPVSPAADSSRREQTFPTLTPAEIGRIRRFGQPVRFRAGERLYVAGQPSPGMFLVLEGAVAAVQRDGMGPHALIAR